MSKAVKFKTFKINIISPYVFCGKLHFFTSISSSKSKYYFSNS